MSTTMYRWPSSSVRTPPRFTMSIHPRPERVQDRRRSRIHDRRVHTELVHVRLVHFLEIHVHHRHDAAGYLHGGRLPGRHDERAAVEVELHPDAPPAGVD